MKTSLWIPTVSILILFIIESIIHTLFPFHIVIDIIMRIIIVGGIIFLISRIISKSNEANTCNLTSIYNRKYIFESLEKEIHRAYRKEYTLSIMLFDIDDFKKINDNSGHYVGDEVLKQLTDVIKNDLRAYDVFSRIGGEEFMIIFPHTDIQTAIIIAERVRKNIENFTFEDNIRVTVSIGLTEYYDGDTIDTLYERVDGAMFEAKERGKNRIIVWDS